MIAKVVSLTQTCSACPSQWEGRTDDDRPVYIRYRWGHLGIEIGEPGWETNLCKWPGNGTYHSVYESGEDMDGFMKFSELKDHATKYGIEFALDLPDEGDPWEKLAIKIYGEEDGKD